MGDYYTPQVDDLEQIVAAVEYRNNTLEKHPAWIALARNGLMIKKLDGIARADYGTYRQYLDNGTLYIIVHPGYYVYFHKRELPADDGSPLDSFLGEHFYAKEMQVLQEQERALRDFLEITSTRNRLVIFVLPGSYEDYEGYVYKNQADEYARYINSVSNGAESVVYLFSDKPNRGSLSRETRERLYGFVEALNPAQILIGGSYVGRCLDDFYREFTALFKERDKILIAGEISTFSPEDIALLDLTEVFRGGRLNVSLFQDIISSGNMKDISFRETLKNRKNYKHSESKDKEKG